MEVKAGYKQTEYGTIPEEWGLMELRNIAKYRRGSFPQPYGLSKWYDDVSGNPFIQVVDVTDEMKLKPETKKRLSAEAEKMSVFAKKGSVIISLNGSVGRVALTHYDGFIDRTLLLFESFLVPIDKQYFIYALSAVFREEEKKAPGAILKTITKEHLSNFLLPLPKLGEQQAIGEALSDADALIEELEQLLAKKSQVKQGAMQELLMGKRRLSGFSKKWETKKFGDIVSVYSGGTPSTEIASYYGAEISWITSSDLNKAFIDDVDGRITKSGLENSSAKMVDANTLLIALYGATAGVTAITRIRAAINQAVLAVIPNKDNYIFLFYKLSYLKDWIITTYTQGGQPNLSGEIVKSIEITVPEPEEQTAIAEILSDMDAEIAVLEGKLSKARQVKAGMMSELLTGRVRLLTV